MSGIPYNTMNAKKVPKNSSQRPKRAGPPKVPPKPQRFRSAPIKAMAESDMQVKSLADSIIDPFNTSACIPDASPGVGCFSLKTVGNLASATGCYGLIANIDPTQSIYTDSTGTGGNPVISGNWTQISTIPATYYGRYRPVSMGVRFSFTGNTQTDSGTIFIGQFSTDVTPTSLSGRNLAGLAASASYYRTFSLRSGMQATWRPIEMDDLSELLTVTNNPVSVSTTPNNSYLIAYVYGASTTTSSVEYEVTWNFEGQFQNQTFLPGGISTKARHRAVMGWYERVQNIVTSFEPFVPLISNGLDVLLGATRSSRGLNSSSASR